MALNEKSTVGEINGPYRHVRPNPDSGMVGFRIDGPLKRQLIAAAKIDDRPVSAVARKAIRDYLKGKP